MLDRPPPKLLATGENVYGHQKRVEWILSHVGRADRIVELGCGTGYMITRQLLRLGYDAWGVDLDVPSIELGRRLLAEEGLDPGRLRAIDLADVEQPVDVIIASEVLEHIPDDAQAGIFAAIDRVLRPGGLLLVTVPNGYGWFELESFLYFKAGIGRVIEAVRLHEFWWWLKQRLGGAAPDFTPSTIADSPHVQRFTRRSIQELVQRHGFVIEDVAQSVLFAGPFSNILLTGLVAPMTVNRRLGDLLPPLAAGFYVRGRKAASRSRDAA